MLSLTSRLARHGLLRRVLGAQISSSRSHFGTDIDDVQYGKDCRRAHKMIGHDTTTTMIMDGGMAPVSGRMMLQHRHYFDFQRQASGTATSAMAATASAPLALAKQHSEMMFCFQCEQTREGSGCKTVGVCGKSPETAAVQDMLIHVLKGISFYAMQLLEMEHTSDIALDHFVQDSLFSTLTNVNFDAAALERRTNTAIHTLHTLRDKYEAECQSRAIAPQHLGMEFIQLRPFTTLDSLAQAAKLVGVESRRANTDNEDILSLQELLTYGIKGMAAYSAHAYAVGKVDPAISAFLYRALGYLTRPAAAMSADELLELCLACGAANLRAMEILNQGHISNFGKPTPTKVRTSVVKGKALLVSGHDLKDLAQVLEQTKGTGINVYTHGEMLPAHGYPELKRHSHLVGNYGGAWQLQKMEFPLFPGPILVTTNCILEPKDSYANSIYSINAVGHSKVRHLESHDFIRPLIEQALAMEGFQQDAAQETWTMTGFGHDAVIAEADQVISLINKGAIKHLFLIGGCDGFEGERSYYRDLARGLPQDAVVLTLGCGKYRFNKFMSEFGNISGSSLPRLMDIGQCNDAYSAIRVATALAQALKVDVNELPLSIVLSWFEQKAVAVLLTLLHLGIRNIRIGPRLPAFVSPNVLQILVDKYKLTPIGDPADDMMTMLQFHDQLQAQHPQMKN